MASRGMRGVLALLFVLGLILGVGLTPAMATPITLQDLIDNNPGSITNGDKLFDNFSYQTVNGPPASSISVSPISTDGLHGLVFQGGFFAGAGTIVDLLIGYDVSVVNSPDMITDIHLGFNGAVTGTGFTSVTETVYDGPDIIGQAHVYNPPPVLSAAINLDYPVTKAHVFKDVLLTGQGNGTATISLIDQLVSQTSVPEPASLLLLGSGLLGLSAWGRKRVK